MLFGTNEAHKNKPTNLGMVMANKLASALLKERIINRLPSTPSKWKEHFDKLIMDHGPNEVSKILDWYIQIIQDETYMDVKSAKSFRERYLRIKRHYERQTGDITLSELGQTILTKVSERHSWPHGLVRDLPRFIQRSLDNYRVFYSKLIAFLDRHKRAFENHNLGDIRQRYCFLEDLHRNCHYWHPEGTILWWAEWVNNQLAHRKNCNRLDYYIWSLTNEHVRRMDEGHAYEYCGDSKLWSYAIETVMGEK